MTAIDTLIADLKESKYSASQQNIIVPVDDFIAALNFIAAGLGGGGNSILMEAGPSTKISALPAAGALTGAELAILVQGGADVQSTSQDIANLGGGGGAGILVEAGGAEKISAMPAAALPLTDTELVTLVQGGTNVQTALSNVGVFKIDGGGDWTAEPIATTANINLISGLDDGVNGPGSLQFNASDATAPGGFSGGGVTLQAGQGTADINGSGGTINITAGNGSSAGGGIDITAGTCTTDIGAHIQLNSGDSTAAGKNGGNILIGPGNGGAGGKNGLVLITSLPTSAVGLPSGALWNNLGVVNIAP